MNGTRPAASRAQRLPSNAPGEDRAVGRRIGRRAATPHARPAPRRGGAARQYRRRPGTRASSKACRSTSRPTCLASISRALRLTSDERRHLYLLAGLPLTVAPPRGRARQRARAARAERARSVAGLHSRTALGRARLESQRRRDSTISRAQPARRATWCGACSAIRHCSAASATRSARAAAASRSSVPSPPSIRTIRPLPS